MRRVTQDQLLDALDDLLITVCIGVILYAVLTLTT